MQEQSTQPETIELDQLIDELPEEEPTIDEKAWPILLHQAVRGYVRGALIA
jgi:hypothetical protein